MTTIYWVVDALFTDGTFSKLEQGTLANVQGPFLTEWEANRCCVETARRNIDYCWHKAFVTKTV